MGAAAPLLAIAAPAAAAALPFIVAGATVIGGLGAMSADAYQSKVAANNAAIARQAGKWLNQEGDIQSTTEGLKTRAQVGATRAQFAASGVDVNSGSAAGIQTAEEQLGQFNAMTIRSNAARAAYGEEVKASGEDAQSFMLKQKSFLDPITGLAGGASTLMTGVQQPSFLSTPAPIANNGWGGGW